MRRPSETAMKKLAPVARALAGARRCGAFETRRPVVVARAPGRLDVMGGVADYSGSLVCEMPLAVAAVVVAQARMDGRVVCVSAQEEGRNRKSGRNRGNQGNAVVLGAKVLAAAAPRKAAPRKLAKGLVGDRRWARYVAGTWWWLIRGMGQGARGKGKMGADPRPRVAAAAIENRKSKIENALPGVTLYVDSDVPLGGGVSSSAAVEVAAMAAGARLLGLKLGPMDLAVACQWVENHVVGAPCGVMDQVTSALGQEGALLEILCQAGPDGRPAQVMGNVQVPKGFAFVGVHSGVAHEVSGDPYTDARVAAFMGQKILAQLQKRDLTHGCLANVPAEEYRRSWRQKLPESMLGRAFLKNFRGTNDPVTKVNPRTVYRVRQGTDHPVFEMERVREFVRLLKQAGEMDGSLQISDRRLPMVEGRTGCGVVEAIENRKTRSGVRDAFMRRAGELMYASHASYSDCAHLGHPLTDKLVAMVRDLGPGKGFYGAKITGGGSGGTVAILMQDSPVCRRRLRTLRQRYERETGRETMGFAGSGPGVKLGIFDF